MTSRPPAGPLTPNVGADFPSGGDAATLGSEFPASDEAEFDPSTPTGNGVQPATSANLATIRPGA